MNAADLDARAREIAAGLTKAQRLHLTTCVELTDAGNGCGAGNVVCERLGLVRVVGGSRGGRMHRPTDLGRAVARVLQDREASP